MLLDIFGSFDTIHLWHFDVQKQQINRFLFQVFDDLLSIFCLSGECEV